MCLTRITETSKAKASGIGWKVFRQLDSGKLTSAYMLHQTHYHRSIKNRVKLSGEVIILPRRKWLKAKSVTVHSDGIAKTYCSGWHLFNSLEDAMVFCKNVTLGVVKKVKWRGQRAKGVQITQRDSYWRDAFDTIVASEILIL